MAKDCYYFPHDHHSRNDDRIQVLLIDGGAAAYGIFWAIIEILHEEESHEIEITEIFYKSFAKQMSTPVEQVLEILRLCLKYGLLTERVDGESVFIQSDRVNRNIKHITELQTKKSKAGKASAQKRAENKHFSTPVEHVLTGVEHIPTNKIKEKEIKEKKIKENTFELLFDKFRTLYPGTKRGNSTEFTNFTKKHSDWKETINFLMPALQKQIAHRAKLQENKQFVPQWKNLQTWINQRCWEIEIDDIGKKKVAEIKRPEDFDPFQWEQLSYDQKIEITKTH